MTIPKDALARWLEDMRSLGYAVAKAPDLWANLERGGDWDIVVTDPGLSERLLHEHVGEPVSVTRRSYVTSYVYSWGHLDLLPGIQWRAVELADAGAVVAAARPDGDGHMVASPVHQALAACVYPRLAHDSFKERYAPLLRPNDTRDVAQLNSALQRIFGPCVPNAEAFLRTPIAILRRQALSRALMTPGGWKRGVRFLYREVPLRLGAS
ncbi:hypothetical protein [Blastococcus deserti]